MFSKRAKGIHEIPPFQKNQKKDQPKIATQVTDNYGPRAFLISFFYCAPKSGIDSRETKSSLHFRQSPPMGSSSQEETLNPSEVKSDGEADALPYYDIYEIGRAHV